MRMWDMAVRIQTQIHKLHSINTHTPNFNGCKTWFPSKDCEFNSNITFQHDAFGTPKWMTTSPNNLNSLFTKCLLIFAGWMWGRDQHWECLQPHSAHSGTSNHSNHLWNKPVWNAMISPSPYSNEMIQTFLPRRPTWPGWTCSSTSPVLRGKRAWLTPSIWESVWTEDEGWDHSYMIPSTKYPFVQGDFQLI